MSNPAVEKREDKEISIPKPHWKKVEDGKYSEEHVINAYLSGKESAINEIADALSKQKVQLLSRGMELTDELLMQLQEKFNVGFEKVFLRQIDFKNIDSLIVLPKDVYFSEEMNKIYESTFQIEDNSEDELEFHVSYTFDLEGLDTEKLSNDGYIFSREP